MPRSNRPRREEHEPLDVARVLGGARRIEVKRDGQWNVQPQSAATALKVYTCPGCDRPIDEGVAHVVTWRADGILGEAGDLAARRHWHVRCWSIRS